jgi:hypothetical protein
MTNIHLVGLGSLGSTIAEEVARRSLATNLLLDLHLYDYDIVEERNCVAQIFTPDDIGSRKTEIVGKRVCSYKTIKEYIHEGKITAGNVKNMPIDEESIVVDAVDNLPTRRILYSHGLLTAAPILHVGMSTNGFGYAQWTYHCIDHSVDTWSLSPKNINFSVEKKLMSSVKGETVPPCELNSMRTLILNTAMAAVNAIFILLGRDISAFVKESTATEDSSGMLSTWATCITSMTLLPELTASI